MSELPKVNIPYLRKIIAKLKDLEKAYVKRYGEANANMGDTGLEYECGTPGCHAGWLAIADPSLMRSLTYDYEDVAAAFLERLWISDFLDMDEPVDAVHHLWPSIGMDAVFSHAPSFGIPDGYDVPLSIIISHWEQFADNYENEHLQKSL